MATIAGISTPLGVLQAALEFPLLHHSQVPLHTCSHHRVSLVQVSPSAFLLSSEANRRFASTSQCLVGADLEIRASSSTRGHQANLRCATSSRAKDGASLATSASTSMLLPHKLRRPILPLAMLQVVGPCMANQALASAAAAASTAPATPLQWWGGWCRRRLEARAFQRLQRPPAALPRRLG